MATSQVAYTAEKVISHGEEKVKQDIADYSGVGDPNQTMKALVWLGKQKVDVVDVPKPKIVEDGDVILKVTGTTVCGSDLHLLHGMTCPSQQCDQAKDPSSDQSTGTIIQLNKGDILGHEFCGVVDQVGPAVKDIKVGKRYVASFQIACGDVRFDLAFLMRSSQLRIELIMVFSS